jgi:hypothetical protein
MTSNCEVGSLNDEIFSNKFPTLISQHIQMRELKTILIKYGHSTSQWGMDESKNLGSLHREIQKGITDLKCIDGKLTRVCIIARVTVYDGNGNELVEVKQEFKHSKWLFLRPRRFRTRSEQRHINKKVQYLWVEENKFGSSFKSEPIPAAARRALYEELEIPKEDLNTIEFCPLYTSKCYTHSSQSYPGMQSYYFIANYEVHLGNAKTKHLIKPFYVWEGKELITTFHWQPIQSL